MGFLLELFLVGAVAELVCQGAAQAVPTTSATRAATGSTVLCSGEGRRNVLERIFQMVGLIQPLVVEHVMGPTSERNACHHAVLVGMRETDRVVAARREAPGDDLLVVNHLLRVDPVQQARPQPIRALGISRRSRGVSGAGDLHDDGRATLHGPAGGPGGELGPVPIKSGEDDDARDFVAGRGALGDALRDLDRVALARDGMLVGGH